MTNSSDKDSRTNHLQAIQDVYRARDSSSVGSIYNPLLAVNVRIVSERQRILTDLLRDWLGSDRLADKDILEIGCGTGSNLLNLISLGASPTRLTGNDLMANRIEEARLRLPSSVRLSHGDAGELELGAESFDLILQSVCFSSILDDAILNKVAHRAWTMLRPGGVFLSYDFTVNNPRNRDVRGIPVSRIRKLFPKAEITARKLTLAPPIARAIPDRLYPILSAFPVLRTHAWCLVLKPLK